MFWGLAFVFIGAGLLLQGLGYIPKSVELFWPVLLIALGLSIIFKKRNCCNDWEVWVDKDKK